MRRRDWRGEATEGAPGSARGVVACGRAAASLLETGAHSQSSADCSCALSHVLLRNSYWHYRTNQVAQSPFANSSSQHLITSSASLSPESHARHSRSHFPMPSCACDGLRRCSGQCSLGIGIGVAIPRRVAAGAAELAEQLRVL